MSFLTVEWAINDAPVKDLTEWAILVAMSQRAREDGTAAYRGKPALARIAKCDKVTVRRVQQRLMERGVIALGDQNLVAHIDAGRRPVVYDILIPFTWYGDKIERINRERADSGYAPLTPANRPPLSAAPEKTARSDKGKPNPKRRPKSLGPAASDEKPGEGETQDRGDSQSPLFEDPQPSEGGLGVSGGETERPPSEDSQSPQTGLEVRSDDTGSQATQDSERANYVIDSVLDSVELETPPVAAVGSSTVRTARAADDPAPAAHPNDLRAKTLLAQVPRYRKCPRNIRPRHIVLPVAQALERHSAAAILRAIHTTITEARFLEHQHAPELRFALARLDRDAALGDPCDGCQRSRRACACEAPEVDRPWTDDDQADLDRALDWFAQAEPPSAEVVDWPYVGCRREA